MGIWTWETFYRSQRWWTRIIGLGWWYKWHVTANTSVDIYLNLTQNLKCRNFATWYPSFLAQINTWKYIFNYFYSCLTCGGVRVDSLWARNSRRMKRARCWIYAVEQRPDPFFRPLGHIVPFFNISLWSPFSSYACCIVTLCSCQSTWFSLGLKCGCDCFLP